MRAGAADTYLNSALEFVATAEYALTIERWNAAAFNAVMAGISAADAALASWAGIRSRESDHEAVVDLLEEHAPVFTGVARQHLIGLLHRKNEVQYYDRVVGAIEAKQLVDHAQRLLEWAQTAMKR